MFTVCRRRYVWIFLITVLIICIFFTINTFQQDHQQKMTPTKDDSKDEMEKQVEGWELNVTRDTRVYVVPEKDTSIISGSGICNGTFNLIVIVFSTPEHFAQRNGIRETWGSYNTSTVKVAFLLGLSKNSDSQVLIEKENAQFQDLIQEDFIDSYNNLTIKSVMMLKWFNGKCPFPTFLMKTDDDMFINLEFLSAILSKTSNNSVLIGRLICKNKVNRDPAERWYIPNYMYQKPLFPNYLAGGAYVMSRDVASKLFITALSTEIFYIEDIYTTGICAEKAGIKPRHQAGFSYEHFPIACYAEMVTNHHFNREELHQIWNQRNNCITRIELPSVEPHSECD